MLAFLDFEASSLGRDSYPIEVAWVFEDGTSEAYLIRPAPGWDDWEASAEAIHHIDRATLLREGMPHAEVAERMVAALTGHDLLVTAPSWDGKWLSALLRAAGLPRHALRLRDSDEAGAECAAGILATRVPAPELANAVADLLTLIEVRHRGTPPAHRALADAEQDRQRWLAVCAAARAYVGELAGVR